MSDGVSLEQNFKVGILKKLYKRQFLTADEFDRAIRAVSSDGKNLKAS
jgi:hypothetical protein